MTSTKKNKLNVKLLECWLIWLWLLKAFPIHLHPCPLDLDELVWSRDLDRFLQDAIYVDHHQVPHLLPSFEPDHYKVNIKY